MNKISETETVGTYHQKRPHSPNAAQFGAQIEAQFGAQLDPKLEPNLEPNLHLRAAQLLEFPLTLCVDLLRPPRSYLLVFRIFCYKK